MGTGEVTAKKIEANFYLGGGYGVGNTKIAGVNYEELGGMGFDVRLGLYTDFQRLVGPVGLRLEAQAILGTIHQNSRTVPDSDFQDWHAQQMGGPSIIYSGNYHTLGLGALFGMTEHIPPGEGSSLVIGREHVVMDELNFSSHFTYGGQFFMHAPMLDQSVRFSFTYLKSDKGDVVGSLSDYNVESVSEDLKRDFLGLNVTKSF